MSEKSCLLRRISFVPSSDAGALKAYIYDYVVVGDEGRITSNIDLNKRTQSLKADMLLSFPIKRPAYTCRTKNRIRVTSLSGCVK